MDLIELTQRIRLMACFCENGRESSGYIKSRNFLVR
jgi:hypothetical protein